MNIFDLSGKIAIVTGGNRGIGYAITKGLSTAGATVIIANRRAQEGLKAAESMKKEGFNVVAVPTDVSIKSSIEALVSRVIDDFGRIDILVNNAAIVLRNPPEQYSEQEFDSIKNTNLRGLFFCCQLVGKEMIKRRGGKIINVTSNAAQKALSRTSIYAASKAGVSSLTRTLAFEWAQYNINVNAIGPAFTMTEMNKAYYEEHPEAAKKFLNSIPKGRPGYPQDYIGAVLFLASDASDFVTGQILMIDGGYTL
jgi:NAD(P)-dependent dehydrogenase (short-subunit alcohol dehydrogenase family)